MKESIITLIVYKYLLLDTTFVFIENYAKDIKHIFFIFLLLPIKLSVFIILSYESF